MVLGSSPRFVGVSRGRMLLSSFGRKKQPIPCHSSNMPKSDACHSNHSNRLAHRHLHTRSALLGASSKAPHVTTVSA